MNSIKYKLYFKYLFFAPLFLYFTINKEFIGLRLIINPLLHNILLSGIIYYLFLRLVIKNLKKYKGTLKSYYNNRVYKILIIVWAFYIISYGFLTNNYSIAFKYFMYLLIFVLMINYDNLSEIGLLGKYFNVLCFSLCLMIMFQYMVWLIDKDIILNGPVIQRMHDYIYRTDATYKSPFFLGLLRIPEGIVNYGNFTFVRHLSYTTEPKYASCLFLVLLISILINKKNDIYYKPMIFITLATLFLVHSYSGFAVIIITGILYYLRRFFNIGYVQIILIFFLGNTISLIIINFVLDYFFNIPDFIYNRIYSHESMWFEGSKSIFSFQVFLGTARHGILGRLFEWINFSIFIYFSDKYFLKKNKNIYYDIAVLLAISCYYVYWITILTEIITPLLLFMVCTIFYLSSREKNYIHPNLT